MIVPLPKRPWYRQKRTWAAGAMWLVLPVLYHASSGPASYAAYRGWISRDVFYAVWYEPVLPVYRRLPSGAGGHFHNYLAWWAVRGWRAGRPSPEHATSA